MVEYLSWRSAATLARLHRGKTDHTTGGAYSCGSRGSDNEGEKDKSACIWKEREPSSDITFSIHLAVASKADENAAVFNLAAAPSHVTFILLCCG